MTEPDQDGPDMAGLLSLLAALPAPQLPPEVATRLDAAIARAVAERVETDGGTALPASRRAAQEPRRRRLWRFALGSAAVGLIAVLGFLVSSVHPGDSSSGSGSSTGAPDFAPLSTAPVTDPGLLSWAAAALRGQTSASPGQMGQAVRPGASALATPGSEAPNRPGGTAAVSPVASCLQARPLLEPSMTQRQLLSSASGKYDGTSAILLVYSNGTNTNTAYIVVFAAPCRGADSTVLSSGVVSR